MLHYSEIENTICIDLMNLSNIGEIGKSISIKQRNRFSFHPFCLSRKKPLKIKTNHIYMDIWICSINFHANPNNLIWAFLLSFCPIQIFEYTYLIFIGLVSGRSGLFSNFKSIHLMVVRIAMKNKRKRKHLFNGLHGMEFRIKSFIVHLSFNASCNECYLFWSI